MINSCSRYGLQIIYHKLSLKLLKDFPLVIPVFNLARTACVYQVESLNGKVTLCPGLSPVKVINSTRTGRISFYTNHPVGLDLLDVEFSLRPDIQPI